jgi:hypothetical protein
MNIFKLNWFPILVFILLAIVPIFGCSAIEVLPGLCYTDKTGTYICLEEKKLYIDPIPAEYDRPHTCNMYYGLDQEQWLWCMDPDNDHLYDPYYQQRKEFRENLYKEKLRENKHSIEAIAIA